MVTLLDVCFACWLTDKPNRANSQTGKGWGKGPLEVEELEQQLDFSPHARAE